MTDYERTGERSLAFSKWHRTLSSRCGMIDIDCCEYCRQCNRPLFFAEVYYDVGQWKPTTVTTNVAASAGVPAYLIAYGTDESGAFMARMIWKIAPDRRGPRSCDNEWLRQWFERKHDECPCRMQSARRSAASRASAKLLR